ncbi:hypothetical protein ES703_110371 [subsurface metagenome]
MHLVGNERRLADKNRHTNPAVSPSADISRPNKRCLCRWSQSGKNAGRRGNSARPQCYRPYLFLFYPGKAAAAQLQPRTFRSQNCYLPFNYCCCCLGTNRNNARTPFIPNSLRASALQFPANGCNRFPVAWFRSAHQSRLGRRQANNTIIRRAKNSYTAKSRTDKPQRSHSCSRGYSIPLYLAL